MIDCCKRNDVIVSTIGYHYLGWLVMLTFYERHVFEAWMQVQFRCVIYIYLLFWIAWPSFNQWYWITSFTSRYCPDIINIHSLIQFARFSPQESWTISLTFFFSNANYVIQYTNITGHDQYMIGKWLALNLYVWFQMNVSVGVYVPLWLHIQFA